MNSIAIIGCGHWGKNYLRVFQDVSALGIHVFDANPAALKQTAQKHSFVLAHESFEDILNDPAIGAVVIATSADSHYSAARAALIAGKHVLVEKPFVLESRDGTELIALAKEKNLILMVSHTFLYNPAIRQIKKHIDSKTCGDIYYLRAVRTHLGLIRSDVNAFWDLAPHDIAIFNYFLDAMPISASATGREVIKGGREDVGFATLVYPGNIIANIHVSWIDSHKEREISIVAAKERIVFDDLNNLEKIRIFEKGIEVERDISNFGEFQLLLRDGNIISPKVDADEPLKIECEHFLDCINHNRPPLTGGENGLEVVRVLSAIDRSVKSKGEPVKI